MSVRFSPRISGPATSGVTVLLTSLGAFGALAVLAPATAYALPSNCVGSGTITCTFSYNGTDGTDGSAQTWTVPAGVTSAYFDLLGAAGGDFPGAPDFGHGGLGGETTGTVSLTPGTTVTILVGGEGVTPPTSSASGGGFNGGGTGAIGGGGASDIRIGGTGLGNRVLVAGGGGGSAAICVFPECSHGGSGGGTHGGDGTSTPFDGYGGAGGTQTAGGVGANGATSGGSGQGGAGSGFSGGGGGGYFGGAGGATGSATGAGGGGSGLFLPDPTRVTGGSTFNGMREGDGLVRLIYTAVPAAATTTTVASSANPATPAQPVTFTATVSPNDGSGTVGFFADGSSAALPGCDTASLVDNGGSWQATCSVPGGFSAGNHPIEARYSGSDTFLPSTGSLSGGQDVGKLSQAITFPALPNRSIVESPFTISGVLGGGSGNPVTFTAGGPCAVSGNQVTLSHTGTCTITAHQAGNSQYDAAPDVARAFTVTGPPRLRIGDRSITEGNSGTHSVAFHVTLSQPVSVPVTVQWHTSNGTATAGSDYVGASGTVTFAAGQTDRTVSVGVKGDTIREANETFCVLLTNPHHATIADGTGVGTILNDD